MVRIILMIFLVALVVAVLYAGKQMACNKPYMLSGTECCLDSNGNSICDKDELTANITRILADNCTDMTPLNTTYCRLIEAGRMYSDACMNYCDELAKYCKRTCIDKGGPDEEKCITGCTESHRLCVGNCRPRDPTDAGVEDTAAPTARSSLDNLPDPAADD